MNKVELQERFKKYAIQIVLFAEKLSKSPGQRNVTNQIVRSASSSAVNYRAACRAKSDADFINKMKIVEEEMDETMFWLEFAVGIDQKLKEQVTPLWKEGNELLSITVSAIKTKRKNIKK